MLIAPEYEVLYETTSPLRFTGTDSLRRGRICGVLLGRGATLAINPRPAALSAVIRIVTAKAFSHRHMQMLAIILIGI
jgi:hypothetical protein